MDTCFCGQNKCLLTTDFTKIDADADVLPRILTLENMNKTTFKSGEIYTSAVQLNFSRCILTDEKFEEILPFLEQLEEIGSLDLSYNNISDRTIYNILSVIVMHNISLKSCSIEGNSLITDQGIGYLSEIICQSSSLSVVNVSGIKIKESLGALCAAVEQTQGLNKLILEGCGLDKNAIKTICTSFISPETDTFIEYFSNSNFCQKAKVNVLKNKSFLENNENNFKIFCLSKNTTKAKPCN